MILTNEQEYERTKKHLTNFNGELAALEAASSRMDEAEYLGKKSGYVRMIAKLEDQLKGYDDLRSGQVTEIECDGLEELPELLTKARIARGQSVEDLAAKLKWKTGALVRLEESEYERATWTQINEVADALRLRLRMRVNLTEPLLEDEELPGYDASASY
jgi:HTH-type transcriptional regulator/antitoxin HigA